jgi:uncharacterized membrane protein YedE/YeeE
LKRGIRLLIVGGALFAVGLVLAGFSTLGVTNQVLKGSTIINSTTLEPNLSFAATTKYLPAGQQVLLSLSGNPSNIPLQVRIIGPGGVLLTTYDIKETPFTSTVTTKVAGDHTVEVKNIGPRSIVLKGALLNSAVGSQGGSLILKDNPSLQNLIVYGIGILVGIVLVIAGIVLLIIGVIRYLRGRKNTQGTTSNITRNSI